MSAPPRHFAGARGGFTLINLLVSVAVLGAMAGVVVVSLEPGDRARVLAASQLLGSDLELAQALSMIEPEDPVTLWVDATNNGYWLARRSDPDTPVLRPNGTPHVVIFGEGGAASFTGIDLTVNSGAENGAVAFDAFGRLTDLENAVLQLRVGTDAARLTTSSTTGFVQIELATVAEPAPPPVLGGKKGR